MSDGSDIRSPLTIERCKITNTPAPSSKVLHKRAISIEIQDNKFKLINNFISSNRIGGIEVKLAQSGGSSLRKNFIYGNTFSFNANGALSVSGRKSNQSLFISSTTRLTVILGMAVLLDLPIYRVRW